MKIAFIAPLRALDRAFFESPSARSFVLAAFVAACSVSENAPISLGNDRQDGSGGSFSDPRLPDASVPEASGGITCNAVGTVCPCALGDVRLARRRTAAKCGDRPRAGQRQLRSVREQVPHGRGVRDRPHDVALRVRYVQARVL